LVVVARGTFLSNNDIGQRIISIGSQQQQQQKPQKQRLQAYPAMSRDELTKKGPEGKTEGRTEVRTVGQTRAGWWMGEKDGHGGSVMQRRDIEMHENRGRLREKMQIDERSYRKRETERQTLRQKDIERDRER